MNLQSVEAALAKPQNQPQQNALASLAPQQTNGNVTPPVTPFATRQPDALAPLVPQMPAMNTGTNNSYGDLFAKALNAAKQALNTRRGDAQLPGAFPVPDGGTRFSDTVSRLTASLRGNAATEPSVPPPPGTQTQAPPLQPPNASLPEIKMFAPSGGGKAYPTYENAGRKIIIDSKVDINNTAAVQKWMDDTNRILDMMNSVYEGE